MVYVKLIVHFAVGFDSRSTHNHDNAQSRNISCSHHRIYCVHFKEHMSNNRYSECCIR